ncbi:hypothetical protein HDU79_004706 [Rhizoclosmatium sp. JEL0117]|nr:hypothetical protein HDU79_004706 [Rhizoclosmatium sp. JEL0117]
MAQEQDLFEFNNYTITVIHNILRRANESLVINCDAEHITSKKQLKAFIGYLAAYASFLHHHHKNEDDIYFPVLIKHGINCDGLTQDHKDLEALLAILDKTAALSKDKKAVAALDPKAFDFASVKENLLQIRATLNPHLLLEETDHSPQVLRDSGLTTEEITKVHNDIMVEEKKQDPFTSLPFFLKSFSPEEKKNWVKKTMPGFVVNVLGPIFSLRFSSYWQFSYQQQVKKGVKFSC